MFFFAGGPGESATRAAPVWAGLPFERNRDLVFVDQRGTRGSGSLYCEALDEPADVMTPRYHLPAVKACRDLLARHADLTKYSTLDAVEDFDAVRQWLGYDRINLLGGSYGFTCRVGVPATPRRSRADRNPRGSCFHGFQAAAVLRPRWAGGSARHLRGLQARPVVPAGIP